MYINSKHRLRDSSLTLSVLLFYISRCISFILHFSLFNLSFFRYVMDGYNDWKQW